MVQILCTQDRLLLVTHAFGKPDPAQRSPAQPWGYRPAQFSPAISEVPRGHVAQSSSRRVPVRSLQYWDRETLTLTAQVLSETPS